MEGLGTAKRIPCDDIEPSNIQRNRKIAKFRRRLTRARAGRIEIACSRIGEKSWGSVIEKKNLYPSPGRFVYVNKTKGP